MVSTKQKRECDLFIAFTNKTANQADESGRQVFFRTLETNTTLTELSLKCNNQTVINMNS